MGPKSVLCWTQWKAPRGTAIPGHGTFLQHGTVGFGILSGGHLRLSAGGFDLGGSYVGYIYHHTLWHTEHTAS